MIEMMRNKKTFAVIRAVYEHRYSPEDFIRELDYVLEKNVNVVIIEPDELGEVTWRWIHTGNWLHKTAVISGLAAIGGTLVALMFRSGAEAVVQTSSSSSSLLPVPCGISPGLLPSVFFGLVSATSAGLYALFWQWDPCSKYQVARSLSALPACVVAAASGSPSNSGSNQSPVASDASSTEGHQSASPSAVVERKERTPNNSVGHFTSSGETELSQRPVVLIRKDDFYRKVLHNTVSIGAVLSVALAVYRWR